MYVSKLKLTKIMCFKKLSISFEEKSKPILWTTFLGDNSTGKTTLLRSIAIGLCDESSAAGLLRESEQGYIRRGCRKGSIEITLREGKGKSVIKTTITKPKGVPFESLKQRIEPKMPQHWKKLFVCAYGIGRGLSGTGDLPRYILIDAVYNLFNYTEGLQNPELVIHRLNRLNGKKFEKIVEPLLKDILGLEEKDKIYLAETGILVDGPWGEKMPLRDLSDGYRSTFQWVIDFVGWALLRKDPPSDGSKIEGIVLVDSIEEHLHPKWQRNVVKRLKDIFPKVQFIVTTHSPLVAAGTHDYEQASLVELELAPQNIVRQDVISKSDIKGLRVDQVLRSKAFGLMATMSPESISDITKYVELRTKKKLSKKEKEKLNILKEQLKRGKIFGDTRFEEEVERAVLYALEKMLQHTPTEIHKLVAKQKLREIFKRHNKR